MDLKGPKTKALGMLGYDFHRLDPLLMPINSVTALHETMYTIITNNY